MRQLLVEAPCITRCVSMSQALVTALLDLPAMMAIAGLPCNVTVRRVSPISGFTMAWQVPRSIVSGAPRLLPKLWRPAAAADFGISTHCATARLGDGASSFACLLQVRDLLGEPQPAVKPDTQLYVPPPRQLYNVSALDWNNGTLPEGQQVTM